MIRCHTDGGGEPDLPNIDAKFSRSSAWKLNQSGELFDMKEAAFEEKPVPAEARDAGAAAARAFAAQAG
jgi:hypothetical protein